MEHSLPHRDLDELSRLLDQEQDRVSLALDACGAGTWDWDITTDQLHWGSGMMRLFGVTYFGNRYEDFERCLEPDDAVMVRKAVDYAIAHHSFFDCKFRLTSRAGVVIRGRGKCYYRDGKPVRMVGVNVEEPNALPARCPIAQVGCPAHATAMARLALECPPQPDGLAVFCHGGHAERGRCPFQDAETAQGV